MQGQYEGEQFELDLGRTRTISRIQFLSGNLLNCPKHVELRTWRDDRDTSSVSSAHSSVKCIDIRLTPAREPKRISVIIRVPNTDENDRGEANAWRIRDIKLTEVRLCGLLRKVIPE